MSQWTIYIDTMPHYLITHIFIYTRLGSTLGCNFLFERIVKPKLHGSRVIGHFCDGAARGQIDDDSLLHVAAHLDQHADFSSADGAARNVICKHKPTEGVWTPILKYVGERRQVLVSRDLMWAFPGAFFQNELSPFLVI